MKDPIKTGASSRATLTDVALAAGLSAATVDRVLNRRAPVRAETARRVRDAAEAVGFHAARLLANRIDAMRPEQRLGFLLQRRSTEVYRDLASELVRATTDPALGRHRPMIEHMDDLTPASVAERVARLGERCDALGIVAADHPKISAAVERLAAAGKPVYALLSDLGTEARAGYFGIDHRKAGRTAGWVLARLAGRTGDVGIVVGSHRYLGHELCEISFRAYLREHAPELRMLEPLASFEDPRFAHEAMLDLLRRKPDLAGLYVPGGGIEGVIAALRDHRPARRVVVVAMDLFTETRNALLDGTIDVVIATPLAAVARGVVAAMLDSLDGARRLPILAPLKFEVCLSENI